MKATFSSCLDKARSVSAIGSAGKNGKVLKGKSALIPTSSGLGDCKRFKQALKSSCGDGGVDGVDVTTRRIYFIPLQVAVGCYQPKVSEKPVKHLSVNVYLVIYVDC